MRELGSIVGNLGGFLLFGSSWLHLEAACVNMYHMLVSLVLRSALAALTLLHEAFGSVPLI